MARFRNSLQKWEGGTDHHHLSPLSILCSWSLWQVTIATCLCKRATAVQFYSSCFSGEAGDDSLLTASASVLLGYRLPVQVSLTHCCYLLLHSDTQLSSNLIKPGLITDVEAKRETSVGPLHHNHYWLAAENSLLDSGLEKVSFPNSRTLFVVIIGSHMKHHPKQRCLLLTFHLQLRLTWDLLQTKKICISIVSPSRKQNFRCHGEGWSFCMDFMSVVTMVFADLAACMLFRGWC